MLNLRLPSVTVEECKFIGFQGNRLIFSILKNKVKEFRLFVMNQKILTTNIFLNFKLKN